MNRKIILKSRPEKEPLKENFQIVEEDLDAVQPGQVQLKSIYLSLDPYMRGRMNAGRSYAKNLCKVARQDCKNIKLCDVQRKICKT